jgi:hypothetical protein
VVGCHGNGSRKLKRVGWGTRSGFQIGFPTITTRRNVGRVSIVLEDIMNSDKRKRLERLQEKYGKKDNTEDVYDEVNEEDYRRHARERVLYDDFVVDDNGEGYADTGEYEWEGGHNYYSDEDEPVKEKPKKKQKTAAPTKPNKDVTQLFRGAKPKPPTVTKPKEVSFCFGKCLGVC